MSYNQGAVTMMQCEDGAVYDPEQVSGDPLSNEEMERMAAAGQFWAKQQGPIVPIDHPDSTARRAKVRETLEARVRGEERTLSD